MLHLQASRVRGSINQARLLARQWLGGVLPYIIFQDSQPVPKRKIHLQLNWRPEVRSKKRLEGFRFETLSCVSQGH